MDRDVHPSYILPAPPYAVVLQLHHEPPSLQLLRPTRIIEPVHAYRFLTEFPESQGFRKDLVSDAEESDLKNMKKWLPVIHPLLFAAFFVLALYAANVAEVSPSEIVIPLVATMGFALLLLLLTLLLIGLIRKLQRLPKSAHPPRIWDLKKAAIAASLFLVLFFSFGHALIAIGGWDDVHKTIGAPGYWFALSVISVALLTCGAYFLIQTRRDLYKLTVVINIVAVTLIIIPTINILIQETKSNLQDTNVSENIVDLAEPDTLPDIYYIVFDRYASARTLKEVYDFDNSEFLDCLSDKGFYVANQSRSNYHSTPPSLSSSLNMDFIHEEAVEEWTGRRPFDDMLEDYKIWRSLKSLGYEFIHFGSWWEGTRENPYADMNFNYRAMPEFSWLLFQTTWAYPLCLGLNIVDEWWEVQYKRVLYKFDKLAEIPEIEEPTFVFAHMLIPHSPFVFDSDGSFLTTEEAANRSIEVQYVDQLIATNNMIRALIDELLSSSEVPPIIVLQADEGPRPERYRNDPSGFKWEEATKAEWREKYGILNAYYLPNVDKAVLYPSITPVNSFRLVFNLYFDTDFKLLPDRSYVYYEGHPYEFYDITDKVKYD